MKVNATNTFVNPGNVTGRRFRLLTQSQLSIPSNDYSDIPGDIAPQIDNGTTFGFGFPYDNATSGLDGINLHNAVDEVGTGNLELLGPFADDTAAAGGGVALNQLYYTAAGTLRLGFLRC